MTPGQFDTLLGVIQPHLKKRQTCTTISAAQRLLITIHFLAEGCSMRELAVGHYVGHATVSVIIKECTEVLWNVLHPVTLKSPTRNEWEKIADGFFRRWNMPNCVGAIDGKHVNIQAPKFGGSAYFNYKKCHSIVLMASCDAFYRFTLVDVGTPGSNHDSVVLQQSGFGRALLQESLPLPPNTALPNTNHLFQYYFTADQAFPLHKRIMRPYPGRNLSVEKLIFNYRLSRARRTIENSFGILAQRWRVLRRSIIADIDTCEKITLATVCLHNYLQRAEEDIPINDRRYCPTGFADYVDVNGEILEGEWRNERTLRSVGRLGSNNPRQSVKEDRDNLTKYFNSSLGCVPWQEAAVRRGSAPE